MSIVLKNGYIVQDGRGLERRDILIENGIISQIAEKIQTDILQTIDIDGKLILPGLIDMDCNICDPGYEYREDIISVSKAGARGGFTTLTCSPNTKPVIDNKTVVRYVISKSKKQSKINIFPYGSMTIGCKGEEMTDMGEMQASGIIGLSDGGDSIGSAGLLRNIFIYSLMLNLPVITSCEDASIAGNGVMNRGFISTQIGLQGIPREAEEVVVSRDVILARHTGARLHINRVSTEGSVNIIRAAKRDGVRVTCGTSPHYFTLSEESVSNYNTLAKVKPPLRTRADVDAIIAALADGTIDVISSGHLPPTIEGKMLEFDKANFGISSLETAFKVSYSALVEKNILPLRTLIEKMSIKPAEILGLDSKTDICENKDADLIIFDPNRKNTVKASNFFSKAKISPYEGSELSGEILYTIVNGEVVYIGE